MARRILRVLIVLASLGVGWAAAKAQTADPDFVLAVDAPAGATTITCVKGCGVKWIERGINPEAQTMSEFRFACTAARCSSGKVGGWMTR